MFASPSASSSTELFYSRRLLLQAPLSKLLPPAATPPAIKNGHEMLDPYPGHNSFDANVVMVLSVLICALICSLGLNTIIRCAMRCSNCIPLESGDIPSTRLVNKGIKKKALKTFSIINYSAETKLPGLDAECVICLSEFAPGEQVRVLPKCNHGFHIRCIDRWLNSHSSCPTCRHCLIETCQKIVGFSQASTSEPPPPQQETIVSLPPLEPEGLVRSY